ncbi:ABC transporter substrate-binding protein [Elioraea tepida]|uniref:ABC transporter substrate-binding protein n=1 Tax=Elioraea tepida TaxID=2843330 RepID=A0A975U3E6_9PROT|nr:ABC transporter substrate-binding protein [Elioraea tepida]QXM25574.1 ABC transporter substrate-binding protein [Elioraea tepida]
MRRRLFSACLVSLPFAAAAPLAAAADLPSRAAGFIEARGAEVIAVINGPGTLEEKRERVAAILREAVDVRGVAQFVLGRHWRTATAPQRDAYLALFEELLVRTLSSRFGELNGASFTVSRAQMVSEDEAVVSTVVTRPNTPAVTLDWRVADIGGKPKIVDLVAEGTSLRITQRSEYSAVVQRSGGVDGLLNAMRQQLAQLEQQALPR